MSGGLQWWPASHDSIGYFLLVIHINNIMGLSRTVSEINGDIGRKMQIFLPQISRPWSSLLLSEFCKAVSQSFVILWLYCFGKLCISTTVPRPGGQQSHININFEQTLLKEAQCNFWPTKRTGGLFNEDSTNFRPYYFTYLFCGSWKFTYLKKPALFPWRQFCL